MQQQTLFAVIEQSAKLCVACFLQKMDKNSIRSQKLEDMQRAIARLLQETRISVGESFTIEDCIDPLKYKIKVGTVRKVAGYDSRTQNYEKPVLARKLGLLLRKCAVAIKSTALEENNQSLLEITENFLKLHRAKFFFVEIGSQAQRIKSNKEKG